MQASATKLNFKKGEHLFRQGDEPKGLFGFVTGEGSVIGTTIDGKDILVAMHREWDWTGFLSILDGKPHAFSVVASLDSQVLHLAPASVRRIFMSDIDSFRYLVAPELAANRAVNRYIIDQFGFTPLQRLARKILDLSLTAYGDSLSTLTITPITQEQIALVTMSSRQWTNRLLKSLDKRGIIAVSRNRIEILKLDQLEQLAVYGCINPSRPDPVGGSAQK